MIYIKPNDVSEALASEILAFVNTAKTVKAIAETIEISGKRDIGDKIAQNILDARKNTENGKFETLQELSEVRLIGPARFTDIVNSFQLVDMQTSSKIRYSSNEGNGYAPLVKFEQNATVPILRYDLPSPTSYEGRNFIELRNLDEITYNERATTEPTLKDFFTQNRERIYEFLKKAGPFKIQKILYKIFPPELLIESADSADAPATNTEFDALKTMYEEIFTQEGDPDPNDLPYEKKLKRCTEIHKKYKFFKRSLEIALANQKYPVFIKTLGGKTSLDFIPIPVKATPRLFLIETYRLTTFPGDYGAGTFVKTFSLLPKEKTTISIKTWKQSEETIKSASSIFDSFTEDKADEFENAVQSENTRSSELESTKSCYVDATVSGEWGYTAGGKMANTHAEISGSVSAGAKASLGEKRASFGKNVMNAASKHSQQSSSKRDVQINTESTKTTSIGEENEITRVIKNVNASRTLNFTFRQMNQQFHSLLHLVDLRLAFHNGFPNSMKEYDLNELEDLAFDFFTNFYPKIKSPDFESLNGWHYQTKTYGSASLSAKKVFLGNKSLKLERTLDGGECNVYQNLNGLVPSTSYKFSAWVWANKIGTSSILNYLSGTQGKVTNTTEKDWELLWYTFTSSSEGKAQIRCRIEDGDSTIAYFDGVRLEKEGNPVEVLQNLILGEYGPDTVFDYLGNPRTFVELMTMPEKANQESTYLRILPSVKGGISEYVIREDSESYKRDVRTVEGIIIKSNTFSMKTDGVIVEALLGQANALDDYAMQIRTQKVLQKKYQNDLLNQQILKMALGMKIVNSYLEKDQLNEAKTTFNELFGIEEGMKNITEFFTPKNWTLKDQETK